MGRLERKIRQSIRKESRQELSRIRQGVVSHRPWWLPRFLWVRIVNIVLNTNIKK